MRYYYSGMPRSNELYHHGILGQKWGVRRYQNSDGSLTPLGRVHYGVRTTSEKIASGARFAGRAVGSAAKATGKKVASGVSKASSAAVKAYKRRHPSLMSDEELAVYTQRLANEQRYKELLNKGASKGALSSLGKAAGNILERGANTLADAAFRKMASEMTKSSIERQNDSLKKQIENRDLWDKLNGANKEGGVAKALRIMGDPNASADDINTANTILKNYTAASAFAEKLSKKTEEKAKESISRTLSESGDVVIKPRDYSGTGSGGDRSWLSPNNATTTNPSSKWSNYKMRPLESMDGSRSSEHKGDKTYRTIKTGKDWLSIKYGL